MKITYDKIAFMSKGTRFSLQPFSFIDTPMLQNYHGKQAARKEGS